MRDVVSRAITGVAGTSLVSASSLTVLAAAALILTAHLLLTYVLGRVPPFDQELTPYYFVQGLLRGVLCPKLRAAVVDAPLHYKKSLIGCKRHMEESYISVTYIYRNIRKTYTEMFAALDVSVTRVHGKQLHRRYVHLQCLDALF